ncbi:MAG: DPP IV N-terminal domain-containing protein, partial [Melioribacteraceae bacterium]|nr:DPP IV N-terminal domain-containing protein [Melioribacteraceae bacterium]
MNRLRIFFILILFSSSLIYSQQKEFTIEDVVLNSYTTLAPSTLKQLTWLPGEYSYSYVEEIDDSFILVKGSATSGRKIEIISLEKLSDEINNFQVTAPKKFPKVTWINDSSFRFNIENNIFVYDFQNVNLNLIAKLGDDAEDITIDPNEKQIAFTIRNNLYVSSENNSINQITFDGKYGLTNGKSVSRNEFGITSGIFWSPKSNYIAFYREDLTNVTDYPLVKIGTTPATLENIKYPMAGQKSQSVGIGVYNLSDGKTIWLKTGGPDDQYLVSVTWGPEEKFIYTAHLNRDQNHLRLIKYDALTGEQIKILFEEKNEKYVEPEHPLYFLPKNKNKFIWFSERDGWNHLYLFNTDGKLLRQLTKGEWIVTKFHGFDYKGENIFIT